MSSTTGSRHNCEQGQPKPQLGGGTAHHNNETTGGAGKGTTTGPTPQGGGGIPWGGGGEGGCGSPASYLPVSRCLSLLLSAFLGVCPPVCCLINLLQCFCFGIAMMPNIINMNPTAIIIMTLNIISLSRSLPGDEHVH